MYWRDQPKIFGVVSIFLHWVTAAAVLTLLGTGLVALYYIWFLTGFRGGIGWFDMRLHIVIGSITLPFIAARVWWRVREGHPEEPPQHPFLEKLTSLNWPIMLMLIVVCYVTGIYLQLLHGNSLEWFGRVRLHPQIYPPWVPQLMSFHREFMVPVHIWAALALTAIIALHIAGALKHWIVDRDGVLERILRPGELKRSPQKDARGEDKGSRGATRTIPFVAWSSIAVVSLGIALHVAFQFNLSMGRWAALPSPPAEFGMGGPNDPVEPCLGDLQTFCPEAQGRARTSCLQQHLDRLAPACDALFTTGEAE